MTAVNKDLCEDIPTVTQMGTVYKRLILNTPLPGEDYSAAILRMYNSPLCETIDNYNCSAYYAPSLMAEAYRNGGF